MSQPRILVFAGSTRRASINARLARAAVPLLEEAEATVTHADLADYPMPLYNGDDEAENGLPEHARRFKALLCAHDGVLIASPEYNSSFTPLLKNTIDWCSRKTPDDAGPLVAYRGKTAALVAASNGAIGGLRGLLHLRWVLANIGMHVMPQQLALGGAGSAFMEDGTIVDDKRAGLLAVTAMLVATTRALKRD